MDVKKSVWAEEDFSREMSKIQHTLLTPIFTLFNKQPKREKNRIKYTVFVVILFGLFALFSTFII